MWILIGVFFVLSLIFLLVSLKLLLARGWVLGWFRGTSGILAGLVVLALAGLGLNLLRFEPISDGRLLQISTIKQSENAFRIELSTPQSDPVQFDTAGDLWSLSVRYLDLPDWLNNLNAPDLYQIVEARGRYLTFQQEMQSASKDQRLSSLPTDLWFVFERLSKLGIWTTQSIRTEPVPVVKGGLFQLVLSGEQFNIIGLNQPAESSLADWRK